MLSATTTVELTMLSKSQDDDAIHPLMTVNVSLDTRKEMTPVKNVMMMFAQITPSQELNAPSFHGNASAKTATTVTGAATAFHVITSVQTTVVLLTGKRATSLSRTVNVIPVTSQLEEAAALAVTNAQRTPSLDGHTNMLAQEGLAKTASVKMATSLDSTSVSSVMNTLALLTPSPSMTVLLTLMTVHVKTTTTKRMANVLSATMYAQLTPAPRETANVTTTSMTVNVTSIITSSTESVCTEVKAKVKAKARREVKLFI